MAAPGQPRAPVATGGFLMLLSALYSYNFIYSRFPPTARSGPSSPSRARLSSSSSGCFLGSKGIRDRYRDSLSTATILSTVGFHQRLDLGLHLRAARGCHLPAAGVFLVARGFATGTGRSHFPEGRLGPVSDMPT